LSSEYKRIHFEKVDIYVLMVLVKKQFVSISCKYNGVYLFLGVALPVYVQCIEYKGGGDGGGWEQDSGQELDHIIRCISLMIS
jgi:hypothetical protein